jgi:lipid II:glycine glycyltransferase (peptidoglycan interpeptide bridge formation enzyme)
LQQTPGFDLLTTKSKVYFDESEPYYKTFLDAYEFKEAAALALAEIASGTVEMKVDL